MGSAHYNFNFMSFAVVEYRKNIAFNSFSVNRYRFDSLAYMIGISEGYIVGCSSELSYSSKSVPFVRNARIYFKTVPSQELYPEYTVIPQQNSTQPYR